MAEKVITVCDWHDGKDVEAGNHNEWTNHLGKRRKNDLCDDHQRKFLAAWEAVERGSRPVEVEEISTRAPRKRPSVRVKAKAGPSEQQIIKAWAKQQGYKVATGGRVPFNIELEWKNAGRPNVLEDPQAPPVS
ncbi:histone-like nucleoid-structuring protein Lsr2 [Nonomuraea sp. NPDC049129]|uniref:Lsr2 dimerization domain-containing protein n=1 Tax=Nonomuraea sp. NPDC049129 TaxID=3155272 RepID=UPI0033C2946E